jgi:[acyl-carrier-protein] S-malonyltransferase
VIPLQVAGAFHTPFMTSDALRAAVGDVAAHDPERTLLSNADGAAVGSGADALERIVRQVTSPVRWDSCQATLLELGVTAAIELAPAGTLAGLAKRAMKGVQVVTVNTPADLPAAAELIADHSTSGASA